MYSSNEDIQAPPPSYFISLIFEVLINLLFTPPLLKTENKQVARFMDYITIISFLKLYTAVRVLKTLSPINNGVGRLLSALSKVNYTDEFLIKSLIKAYPLASLATFTGTLISISAYFVYISERYKYKEGMRG